MYVGRFVRNEDVKGDAIMMSELIFQRIGEKEYEKDLKEAYLEHQKRTGKGFYNG